MLCLAKRRHIQVLYITNQQTWMLARQSMEDGFLLSIVGTMVRAAAHLLSRSASPLLLNYLTLDRAPTPHPMHSLNAFLPALYQHSHVEEETSQGCLVATDWREAGVGVWI